MISRSSPSRHGNNSAQRKEQSIRMASRPEITGHRFPLMEPYFSDLDSFSVEEFARRNSISVSAFYQMKREGWGPETFFVGKRQLVSREAAERWRRERERVAAAERPIDED